MNDEIVKAHALADGELDGAEKTEATAAVAADSRLAAEHAWAVLFKTHLREKVQLVTDDDVWRSCRRRLDEIDRVNKAQNFVGKYAWALCALFLAGILFAGGMDRMNPNRQLRSEHVAGLLNGLREVRGEPNRLLDELNRLTGSQHASPNVAQVVGGAVGSIDGRRVVRLELSDGRGPLSLFAIQAVSSLEGLETDDAGFRCGAINDRPAVSWKQQGCLLILVATRTTAELKQIAESIRNEDK